MKKTERKIKTAPLKSASKLTTPAETGHSSTNAEPAEYLSLTEIKELIEMISEKQFNQFELERGSFRLRLQKGLSKPVVEAAQQITHVSQAAGASKPVESVGATPMVSQSAPAPAPIQQEEKLHIVNSPIVGVFYRASSPTAEPFVKLGDAVEAGKTLCIIEAMKLMNEIHSDASGTVAKIFVENGQPVEYGQPLFGIKV